MCCLLATLDIGDVGFLFIAAAAERGRDVKMSLAVATLEPAVIFLWRRSTLSMSW